MTIHRAATFDYFPEKFVTTEADLFTITYTNGYKVTNRRRARRLAAARRFRPRHRRQAAAPPCPLPKSDARRCCVIDASPADGRSSPRRQARRRLRKGCLSSAPASTPGPSSSISRFPSRGALALLSSDLLPSLTRTDLTRPPGRSLHATPFHHQIIEQKHDNHKTVLYQCGTHKPTDGELGFTPDLIVSVPVTSVAVTSTTFFPLIELLGVDARNTIKHYTNAFSHVSSTCLQKLFAGSGTVASPIPDPGPITDDPAYASTWTIDNDKIQTAINSDGERSVTFSSAGNAYSTAIYREMRLVRTEPSYLRVSPFVAPPVALAPAPTPFSTSPSPPHPYPSPLAVTLGTEQGG